MNFNYKKGFGALASAVMVFSATGAPAVFAQEPATTDVDDTTTKDVVESVLTINGKGFGEAKIGSVQDVKLTTTVDLKDLKANLLKGAGNSATREVNDHVTFTATAATVTTSYVLPTGLELDPVKMSAAVEVYENDFIKAGFGQTDSKDDYTKLVFTLGFDKLFETAKKNKATVAEFINSIPDEAEITLSIPQLKATETLKVASNVEITATTDANIALALSAGSETNVTLNQNDTVEPLTLTVTNDENLAMYRMYNPNSGEHFYTADAGERDHLESVGWTYEMIGWVAPDLSREPVYRLYNENAGDHHYTVDKKEHDALVALGWKSENIGWYSAGENGTPLYRQYNPNATVGTHNFTSDMAENNALVNLGWKAEGVAWYAVKAN